MSTSGGGLGGGTFGASAHLNAAALGTLYSAPTVLVAAPGVGLALIPTFVAAEYKAGVDTYQTNVAALYWAAAPLTVTQQASVSLNGTIAQFIPPVNLLALGPTTLFQPARTVVENKALVVGDITADALPAGPIVTAAVAAGGTSYAVNDTGTITTDQYTGGATYTVTSVAAITGAVTGFTVTAAGDGYTTNHNPLATATGGGQAGVGVNFTVNVTAVHETDGDLYVSCSYSIFTLN
jgi:hypothetical protein